MITSKDKKIKNVSSVSITTGLFYAIPIHIHWNVSIDFLDTDKFRTHFLENRSRKMHSSLSILTWPLIIILRYIAAVIQGHVVPDVPYISDAATYSPESCVFGQLISIGCILREYLKIL